MKVNTRFLIVTFLRVFILEWKPKAHWIALTVTIGKEMNERKSCYTSEINGEEYTNFQRTARRENNWEKARETTRTTCGHRLDKRLLEDVFEQAKRRPIACGLFQHKTGLRYFSLTHKRTSQRSTKRRQQVSLMTSLGSRHHYLFQASSA